MVIVKALAGTNVLFHNVYILKLPDLVKLKTAIIMFEAYYYILPMNVQKLFKIHDSRYSSRHKCKFKQIYVRTNLKSMCISVTAVKLWNSLDNSWSSCKNFIISKSVIQIDCSIVMCLRPIPFCQHK